MTETVSPKTGAPTAAAGVQAVPAWTSAYKLPAQLEAELAIAELEEQIQQLQAELVTVSERMPHATRYSTLLFEQNGGLFAPVREALELLGGTVPQGVTLNTESVLVVDPQGRAYLVSIVGGAGPIRAGQIRQLLDREFEVVDADPKWNGKALLIANPQNDVSPRERKDGFPDSVVRMAVRFGQCLLPTSQLFEAVRQQQIGMFDKAAFWDSLYNTIGVCTLAEPAALRVEDEDARLFVCVQENSVK